MSAYKSKTIYANRINHVCPALFLLSQGVDKKVEQKIREKKLAQRNR
jgi:hypothetical protein